MTRIHPLILCGGKGTRLWPVSRTESPKQFQQVGEAGSRTFFQEAVERHRGPGYARPCIVAAWRHREIVAEQLAGIGCDADVIHEPVGRNSGPAVLAAAMVLYARDPEALMVVVPADHVIDGDLTATIMAMEAPAAEAYVITFGIKPRYAETGFGYITDGGPIVGHPGLHRVERFVEKPPRRKARLLVESDIAYWASGLSMFAARTIIEEYHRFDPATVAAVRGAVAEGTEEAGGLRLDEARFTAAASAPTESAVFEKTGRIALAPLDVAWSDVGSWTAMYGISRSDAQGNVLQGDVIAVESKNSMVRSSSRLVALVGMEDVIVIDTPDALLVTRVGQCQNVKIVAEHLRSESRSEAETHRAPDTVPDAAASVAALEGVLSAVEATPDQPDTGAGPAPAATGAADVPAAPGLSRLLRTASLEMASAPLAPGENLILTPGARCELMVAKGALEVAVGETRQSLGDGGRIELTPGKATVLTGAGPEGCEFLLLIRFAAGDAADDPLSRAVNG